jgi:hypothetical protein
VRGARAAVFFSSLLSSFCPSVQVSKNVLLSIAHGVFIPRLGRTKVCAFVDIVGGERKTRKAKMERRGKRMEGWAGERERHSPSHSIPLHPSTHAHAHTQRQGTQARQERVDNQSSGHRPGIESRAYPGVLRMCFGFWSSSGTSPRPRVFLCCVRACVRVRKEGSTHAQRDRVARNPAPPTQKQNKKKEQTLRGLSACKKFCLPWPSNEEWRSQRL